MRKLWPILKDIWTLFIISLMISVIAQLFFEDIRPGLLQWILSNQVLPILAILFLGLILLTFFSWWRHNQHVNQQLLESEFGLYVKCENLKPEHFDYEIVDPGETPYSGRPFHKLYVPRFLTKFEDSNESSYYKPAETFLSERLRNGATVALLGQQTEGKTRTIFEVCKELTNFTILRPRITQTPTNSAIQLLKGKNLIIVFDDFDLFVRKDYDPKEMIRRIKARANKCGVIVICRNSEELKAVKSDQSEYSTPLSRFFSDITERYQLIELDEDGKMELWKSTRTDDPPESFEFFKTVGSICMKNGYQVMRDKFDGLPPKSQNCIWAMQLLLRGSIQPLSHKRLKCIMHNIFQLPQEPTSSTLRALKDKGFLKSDDDPIIPEVAYLRWWGSDSVITYRGNRLPEDDFDSLNKAIESCGDVEALMSLGFVHGTECRHSDALYCFDLSPELKQQVSPEVETIALINKGVILGNLNQHQDSITAWEEVITRFGDSLDPDLLERVTDALFNKGLALLKLKQPENMLKAWDEIIYRFGDTSVPNLMKQVAKVLYSKGAKLAKLERPEDAITAWEELIRRFGNESDQTLQKHVANALIEKGLLLSKLNQTEDMIITMEEVIIRFGDASDPNLRDQVAGAFLYKGRALEELNQPKEAINTYDEIITRFGNASDRALRIGLADALLNKGLVLRKLNQTKNAITAYEDFINRFSDTSDPILLVPLADTLMRKGLALQELDQPRESINTYEELITRFGNASEPALLELVAGALHNKGLVLHELKEPNNALSEFEEVITRFYGTSEPALRRRVAGALLNKGVMLALLNRHEDARVTWKEVITHFCDDSDPAIKNIVSGACNWTGNIEG